MHSPDTQSDTQTGAVEEWLENANSENTATDLSTTDLSTTERVVRRLLTDCFTALKNWFNYSKTHYYHISDLGTYFFLEESIEFADEVYITSSQPYVEPTDFIKIEYASSVTTYRILELQRYSNSPNICVARLKALPSDCELGQS